MLDCPASSTSGPTGCAITGRFEESRLAVTGVTELEALLRLGGDASFTTAAGDALLLAETFLFATLRPGGGGRMCHTVAQAFDGGKTREMFLSQHYIAFLYVLQRFQQKYEYPNMGVRCPGLADPQNTPRGTTPQNLTMAV